MDFATCLQHEHHMFAISCRQRRFFLFVQQNKPPSRVSYMRLQDWLQGITLCQHDSALLRHDNSIFVYSKTLHTNDDTSCLPSLHDNFPITIHTHVNARPKTTRIMLSCFTYFRQLAHIRRLILEKICMYMMKVGH